MKHPGDGCDIDIRAAHVTFDGFTLIGDGGLAVRVDAPGCTFSNCATSKLNSFLWIEPPGVGTTAANCVQLDQCGGQWIYDFADRFTWLNCQASYGSGAEEPLRFSAEDPKVWPGALPPVGCLVSGGSINQQASAANFQKSAFAVRSGNVRAIDVWINGALTAGQKTGADTAVLLVDHCTFDADKIYPNISTQSGVRLSFQRNRFRGGGQPASLGNGSTLKLADSNTIVGPSGKSLVFHESGAKEDGTNTVRTAAK
jgi:hypothetical protein